MCGHGNGRLHGREHLLFPDTGQEEGTALQSFGPLGDGAEADGGEGKAVGAEEAALLRQGTAVGENAEGVQLQPVVIVKAQRRVDPDQGVEDPGMELQPLLGPGMTGVQDRLAVLLCQAIDGAQQGEERLLRVNIFLPVG